MPLSLPSRFWTRWPLREALAQEGVSPVRKRLARLVRALVLGALLWATAADSDVRGWVVPLGVAGVLAAGVAFWALFRTSLRRLLWPSVALLLLLEAGAFGFHEAGLTVPSVVLWCACAVTALERLPLAAAVPCTAAALVGYALLTNDGLWATALTTAGLALAGYTLRLDAEARGNAHRLLAQERAARAAEAEARAAEAESAALAERGRIAREIHDVLAHSLSAQLVHLEAARLLIQRSPDLEGSRAEVLERVTAARKMAREGLDGTREALSALRGEMPPVEEFLRELAASEGARLDVAGERRTLPPEAGLAVRRVAQEALTNVRKHAPGARVELRLEYAADQIGLRVRDSGGQGAPGELADSGSGYGLRGMRERAELLGGTLESGPDEEGFVVWLRVPA
ncbi:histidine kinase [Streptomyces olivaceiscleroticus]|uniref:histidine kinase n=1 Tax=Streptomyces olivaceiscleroticus TaxID=68245 RepID=A0ABN1AGR4_9ACTN